MLTQCRNIQTAKVYSEDVVQKLRAGLEAVAKLSFGSTVIIVGSLARREASSLSDVDYFVVYEADDPGQNYLSAVNTIMESVGLRAPSIDGAFASTIKKDDLLATIGGSEESNGMLTRRMLLLLESDWIAGKDLYEATVENVINLYIKMEITQHQLARFFLNDVIRYYRTICVDFEYKTGNVGKSWGDRNVKIMFSRKLLYFSGVIAAAETAQSIATFKRMELGRLLRMNPIERVCDICGLDAIRAMTRYDSFLGWLSDPEVRELLKSTSSVRKNHTDEFRGMKNSGHHFSWELESLLRARYPATHPIYQALLL